MTDSATDLLIVAAMPEEADAVGTLCDPLTPHPHPFTGGKEVSVRRGHLCFSSADGDVASIALITSGIGTAAAAGVASWALTEFQPRVVLNVGSCGGLAADITVGSVVVGTEYAYSIADATAFGYAAGQVPGAPVRFTFPAVGKEKARRVVELCEEAGVAARAGLMISGDAFVTAESAELMREKFPGAVSADMETTALAHTCLLRGVPFLAVRAVSDLCSPRAGEEFHVGLGVAAAHSAAAMRAALPILMR